MKNKSKVWLVTGSASGLGRNIAEAVLASGDRLVATARDPRRLKDLVEKYGDQVRTGRLALPGSTPYHAAKWAVGGFTESLAQEVAPFGVKVCALEPGGMRTNWGTRAHQDLPELLPDYEPSVGAVVTTLKSHWGQENGDPAKVAQVILRLAGSDRLPPHLLL